MSHQEPTGKDAGFVADRPLEDIQVVFSRAAFLNIEGKPEEAKALYEAALERPDLAEGHVRSLHAYLADTLEGMGEYEEAIPHYAAAIERSKSLAVVTMSAKKANAERRIGRSEDAIETAQTALTFLEENRGQVRPGGNPYMYADERYAEYKASLLCEHGHASADIGFPENALEASKQVRDLIPEKYQGNTAEAVHDAMEALDEDDENFQQDAAYLRRVLGLERLAQELEDVTAGK